MTKEPAFWGSSTERAIENFPISGIRFSGEFIRVLALIKASAAEINKDLKQLEPKLAKAIVRVSEEIAHGKYSEEFPVDIFQTGSGTSTNMNFNEVTAHIANKALGSQNPKAPIHPNDHVNLGQSSNDVFPTAIHITAALLIRDGLLPSLKTLEKSLTKKGFAFKKMVKTGRTHLQDAVPITLGQEFSGYATQIQKGIKRLEKTLPSLYELAIGGTAVGTGFKTHPAFGKAVIKKLANRLNLPLRKADNPFEAQASKDACVEVSGALRGTSIGLIKIANDIRLMASGPRCGLAELELPELQPGSSMMPGKVNPVEIEMLLQVCAQVIGNDTTVALSGMGGQFELNAMMPVLAHNLFQSISLLTKAVRVFERKCIQGIKPNVEHMARLASQSLMLATALAPEIGYDKAAEIAKKAYHTNKSVFSVAQNTLDMPKSKLAKLLDPAEMT